MNALGYAGAKGELTDGSVLIPAEFLHNEISNQWPGDLVLSLWPMDGKLEII